MLNVISSLLVACSIGAGQVRIDGSSTVYPITEAVAEAYADEKPDVRVTVGISGTGGGFKRFASGETDISDASRPIKKKEHDACKENGISYYEIPVAYDGLTIVVNKENTWCNDVTVDELKSVFLAGGVSKWSEIRPEFPDEKIRFYSPGTDSGTFDYFKEVIVGKKGAIRSDMSVSEDDNVLVKGVAGDKYAIGFFGYAYYIENKDKLKSVGVMNPKTGKVVLPDRKTIESGEYAPFSRPLFIYVNARSMRRPDVRDFVRFYRKESPKLCVEVGYVSLPKQMYLTKLVVKE